MLEHKLQGELHNPGWPRRTDLAVVQVVLVPSAGAAKRRTAVRVGSTSVTEDVHALPLRVVESIERLPTELQSAVFTSKPRQLEVLEQGHIPIVPARTRQRIAPHIAEHTQLAIGAELGFKRLGEGFPIKPGGGGPELGIVIHSLLDLDQHERVAANARPDSIAEPGNSATHVNRRPGEEAGDAADLPAAQRIPGKPVRRCLEERQGVT